jgi:hypothetical protein
VSFLPTPRSSSTWSCSAPSNEIWYDFTGEGLCHEGPLQKVHSIEQGGRLLPLDRCPGQALRLPAHGYQHSEGSPTDESGLYGPVIGVLAGQIGA